MIKMINFTLKIQTEKVYPIREEFQIYPLTFLTYNMTKLQY